MWTIFFPNSEPDVAMNDTAKILPPSGDRGRVVLGTSCTIHEAAALKAQLIVQLQKEPPLTIDGSAVERVDAAGLQVVVAFAIDCLERNIDYTWSGRSAKLTEAIRLMGVAPLLESRGAARATAR